jgi:isocitrate/isopropylmalate dehydrogenase
MRLVRKPRDFDVLLCGNLFGDIVSDCAAGMAGGVTVATGVAHGPGVLVFENPHGPDVAQVGEDGANPLPMALLASEMLKHLGEVDAARRVRASVEKALAGGVRTYDMGGSAKCSEVRAALLAGL